MRALDHGQAPGRAAASLPTKGERAMEIKRNGSQPSGKGPPDYFTGSVRIDPLFQAPDPARVTGAYVTFEPGARTAWHTHPLGQTLIVTFGLGWTQLGRPDRGTTARRCGLVSARCEALAWGDADDGDHAYRHPGTSRWKGRGLDGEGQRRTVRQTAVSSVSLVRRSAGALFTQQQRDLPQLARRRRRWQQRMEASQERSRL